MSRLALQVAYSALLGWGRLAVQDLVCADRIVKALGHMMTLVLTVTAVTCLPRAHAGSQSDTRVAIVIGNAAYPFAPLANPTNDARAVSETLKGMGFTVFEVRDASKAQMQAAIAQANAALKGRNGVGMLYYAGHGLQLDWHNYLVPVDAQLNSAADVRSQTVDIQTVMDAFRSAGNRLSIVVLDACRDNPIVDSATGKGLAQLDAPPGTLLAYATAPGSVAEDGDVRDGNGLYTYHLVREMKQPGAKLEDVFKRVRLQVRRQSDGRQVPWESTSLEDDFYFDPAIKVVTLADASRASQASLAIARQKADWKRIQQSVDPQDFVAFLRKYPQGAFSGVAELFLGELRTLTTRAKPGEAIVLPDARNWYATGDTLEYEQVDGYTRLVTHTTLRVTFADNDQVEFDDGRILAQDGGVRREPSGTEYTPARMDRLADLTVGKKWRSEFTSGRSSGPKTKAYCDYKVAAFEEVTVPAGTFKAFKIEREGRFGGEGYRLVSGAEWVDSGTLFTVRVDVLNRYYGRIAEFYSARLSSIKRAPRRGDAF